MTGPPVHSCTMMTPSEFLLVHWRLSVRPCAWGGGVSVLPPVQGSLRKFIPLPVRYLKDWSKMRFSTKQACDMLRAVLAPSIFAKWIVSQASVASRHWWKWHRTHLGFKILHSGDLPQSFGSTTASRNWGCLVWTLELQGNRGSAAPGPSFSRACARARTHSHLLPLWESQSHSSSPCSLTEALWKDTLPHKIQV